MRHNLNQLMLSEVNDKLSNEQQQAQWTKEVDAWFKGWETIRVGDDYIIEERVIPLSADFFNKTFGTDLKY